jgi:urea transport system permease protein
MRCLPALLLLCLLACLHAADPSPILPRLASEEAPERAAALRELALTGDPRLAPFLQDYIQGSAYLLDGRVVLIPQSADGAGVPLDPLSRAALGPAVALSSATELPLTRRDRIAANEALNRLALADPDPVKRMNAVTKAGDSAAAGDREALAGIAAGDPDPRVRRSAAEGVAMIDLAAADPAVRAAACAALAELASARARDRLREVAEKDADPATRTAAAVAIERIASYQNTVRTAQTVFSGLSLGSILVIMALGLAITFGLMGVINMAHGEMLMIGAYATLLVQWFFAWALPPALMPWYFPCGLVAGFLCAAAVGWLLEFAVLRHLYGRPLETLLATIGIGQVLIWSVRRGFGDNQGLPAPDWLTGGWEPMPDLVLPWNRLFIIAVTAAAVIGVWMLMNRTRLGLTLRATVQSRRTAASLGIDTRRIDGLTFAIGSGLAGAAGCALTLIGGLKPDMGQEFIIDSFLVVAAGGVGNLWGVVWTGLGIGVLNKFLEPFTQAVYAKVIVLAIVILFLQWRPSGLFPPKGRLADA